MKLEKAIEIGRQYRRDKEPHDLQDFEDFVNLGTEALQKLQEYRPYCQFDPEELLPGETE